MRLTRREFMVASAGGLLCPGAVFAAEPAPPPLRAAGEDGYDLWLRFPPLENPAPYRPFLRQIIVEGDSTTAGVIRLELSDAIQRMLGAPVPSDQTGLQDGAVVVGTPENSGTISGLRWEADLAKLGAEGYVIRPAMVTGRRVIAIASEGEFGALYGTYHFLRLIQTAQPIDRLNVSEKPKVQLRLVNHWDNLNGTIERGYAGRSLWQWSNLPGQIEPRYADYARANASIGINGAVINNVNADVRILSAEYLAKAAALAETWRPYGIRLYLSANFAAPVRLGSRSTADPLNRLVADWWKAKADEIYQLIPDFGGFVVKANSEGQPGPKDYNRSHAEGANVLAEAIEPHGGNVIWRAFIYDEDVDPDRAKRAYLEFTKLDGRFRPNVLVQVKNGPIDFMPREPFHPLFGAMKKTPVMAELQATQEYLGQAKHLVYLGTMWKEFLDADTFAKGPGSTVAQAIDGTIDPYAVTGMAAVINPGSDANWCGHHFSQANWYASGRLAWNHQLTARQIAEEWARMTFTNDAPTVNSICDMMMSSRETFVNYTMPLGLHHLIGGDHYAPMPANARAQRSDWTATYYHQASPEGVGFDRTMKGDKAVEQYFPPVRDLFDNLATCPDEFLLWFHRCAWDYKMKSGKTLWVALCEKYQQGVKEAAALQSKWQGLSGKIDARRHKEVADRLAIQVRDAAAWRDEILKYFQQFSQMPIPPEPPA